MKPQIRPRTLSLFILTLLLIGKAYPDSGDYRFDQPIYSPEAIEIVAAIEYGSKIDLAERQTSLRLDLYSPPGLQTGERRPLIILIHGGGFINGDKAKHADWAAEYARHGFVAVSISYRLTPAEIRNASPENFIAAATLAAEDGADAIRFLKANAEKYRIDPARIATIGMSAGGWVSVINAIEPDTFNGSLSSYPEHSSRVAAAIATGVSFADNDTCKQVRDRLLSYDSSDAPVLLFHAEEADQVTTATWADAQYLANLISTSGNHCQLYKQPGRKHVDNLSPNGPYWAEIASFLGSVFQSPGE